MHGGHERRRSSGGGHDSSDEEGFEVEVDELINDSRSLSRQYWWKRGFSLKRSETGGNATSTAAGNGIISRSSASNSLFDRIVIHPDNRYVRTIYRFFYLATILIHYSVRSLCAYIDRSPCVFLNLAPS